MPIDILRVAEFSPRFLTWENGFLFSLDLCILVFLTRYIFRNFPPKGLAPRRLSEIVMALKMQPGVDLAIGWFVYIFGQSISRGWTLIWRHELLREHNVDWMSDYQLLGIGTLIVLIGALCCVRMLSSEFGWRGWVLCGVVSFALSGVFLVI